MGRKNFFVVKHLGRNVNQAGKAQWRELELPTNVARVRFGHSVICCFEFVIGSRLAPRVFSGQLVFFLSLRPTSPNSNSTRKEDPRDNSQVFIAVCHGVHLTLVSLLHLYNHLITKPQNNNSF